jgi:hypothetical protein
VVLPIHPAAAVPGPKCSRVSILTVVRTLARSCGEMREQGMSGRFVAWRSLSQTCRAFSGTLRRYSAAPRGAASCERYMLVQVAPASFACHSAFGSHEANRQPALLLFFFFFFFFSGGFHWCPGNNQGLEGRRRKKKKKKDAVRSLDAPPWNGDQLRQCVPWYLVELVFLSRDPPAAANNNNKK